MRGDSFHGIDLGNSLEADFKVDDFCWNCEVLIIPYYDHKYHGFLGYCPKCKAQWRLS